MALHPDLILHGGRIATLDAAGTVVEALAVLGGRIVARGSDAEIMGLAGPGTRMIDLAGRTAIPGIVDSHCHPDSYAARLARWHDVGPAAIADRGALLDRIARACRDLPADGWFAGYRFNDHKSGGFPIREELDAASGGRPVFILRTDGHLGVASSAAFAACGISDNAEDPPFGRFDRHPATNRFTGLLRETATHIFLAEIHGGDTEQQIAGGLKQVFADWNRYGITTVYNSLAGARSIRAYQLLEAEGGLTMRVGIIVSGREDGLVESYAAAGIRSGFGSDWVRVIGVEWCPDCSTSGRTAAYYEPYVGKRIEGEPENNCGMLLYEADDLKRRATLAHKAGLQVMIEGLGDRGIDFALDAIEAALTAHPVADHRMRVEHCCYVTPPILERIKRLGVVDSSATGFMYDLGDGYIANRGQEAMRWMWPHRSLIDAGIPAPGHSDAMVCQANPFVAIWSMVNRRSDSGGDLDIREAITVDEALRAYTILGAWSGREEAIKGSLEVGKLADIAVLDRDPYTIPADELRRVRVDVTIVDGRICHGG
ncbi:amidohydrolase [Allostella vacuolata]|nr:amidohydrolase [Stella vacuolata]